MKLSLTKSFLILIGLLPIMVAQAAGVEMVGTPDIRASMSAFKIVYQEDLDRQKCSGVLEPDWFIASRRFGSVEIETQVMNYLLTRVRGGDRLIQIFKLASSSLTDFRRQLDIWLLERAQMRAVTLSELKSFLSQNPSVDFPIFDSPEDEARGFISHKAYTFAVLQGLFPMGDPHDLFFHIPSFLDPRFAETLKRIAKLIFETSGRAEFQALFTYLTGVMRAVGVENWSYLIANSASNQSSIFLQGNKPFYAINDLTAPSTPRNDVISSFVNVQGRDSSVYGFVHFPQWPIFAKRETAKSILRKLEPMLVSIEISSDYANDADRRFRAQIGTSIEVSDFLPKLSNFINRDPLLRSAFSSETRGQISKLLLDLLDDYWVWIRNQSAQSRF